MNTDEITKIQVLSLWLLRFFGNLAAHEATLDIKQEEVKILDGFLSALLEYVYIAPKKS